MEKLKKTNNEKVNLDRGKNVSSRSNQNVLKNIESVSGVDLDDFSALLKSRKAKRVTIKASAPAYCYIHDTLAQDRKFLKDLSIIENRLTDLGLSGKIHRLSRFKNLKEIIEDDVKSGVKNIVVVGSDDTFLLALGSAPNSSLVFGFIPLEEKSVIAELLGIDNRFHACQVLSARLIQKVDAGRVNNNFFLSSLKLPHCSSRIICDNKFSISAKQDRDIEIFNLHIPKDEFDRLDFTPNACDGRLELVVKKLNKLSIFGGWRYAFSPNGRDSIFSLKKIIVETKNSIPVIIDGKRTMQQNPEIEVIPNAFKLVVGKNRII